MSTIHLESPARGGSRAAKRLALLTGLLLLTGCPETRTEFQIEKTRVARRTSLPVLPDASSEERFTSASALRVKQNPFTWNLPDGWQEVPETTMRLGNFLASDGETEAYISLLPGRAGGLVSNVNRWRGQMGLGDLTAAEVAELPKIGILGAGATVVELEGTFTGMGATPRENHRMLGAILPIVDPEGALFVKMTGPAATVERERDAFFELCASLEIRRDGDGAPPREQAPPPPAETQAEWLFEAPSTWAEESGRAMRELSFRLGERDETECYVTVLQGDGGGLAANINRWARQLGMEALGDTEIADLKRVVVLGRDSAFFEGYGSFQGMTGEEIQRAGMLGVVCSLPAATVFVKMVGSEEDVRAERDEFLRFCSSLRWQG